MLYFDTDWIKYIENGTKHVQTGDMLGEMTNELSGKAITNIVSTGLKSSCFKFGDNQ